MTNPFFNESDFQTIHVEVSMINNNTGMMLKDGKQIFKDRTKNFRLEKVKRTKYVREKSDNSRVDLCEFLENGILIETPKMSCAKGHVLAILIETFRARDDIQMLVTGADKNSKALFLPHAASA